MTSEIAGQRRVQHGRARGWPFAYFLRRGIERFAGHRSWRVVSDYRHQQWPIDATFQTKKKES